MTVSQVAAEVLYTGLIGMQELLHPDKACVEDFSSNLTDSHPYLPLRLPHEFA